MKKCEYTGRSKTETPLVKGELPDELQDECGKQPKILGSLSISPCEFNYVENGLENMQSPKYLNCKDLRRKQHLYRVSMQREPRNSVCTTLKSELSQTQS